VHGVQRCVARTAIVLVKVVVVLVLGVAVWRQCNA
jgi:hypothetical protein